MIADTVTGALPSREVGGPAVSRKGGGRFLLAVPLLLVNSVAVWGQAGWARDNITHGYADLAGWAIALAFAAAVESIGIYLAWESHESLMADQASFGLRLGSYGVGLLAGILNFLHFSPEGIATGIAFGGLSAVSPWLWSVWSRARNRGRLAQLGLVDVRAVKLSASRKLWHPLKSLQVISWATWAGVTDPADAVAGWEASRTTTPAAESVQEPTTAPFPVIRPPAPPAGRVGVREERAVDARSNPHLRDVTRDERVAFLHQLRADHPDWTQVRLASEMGVSDRWIRGVLAEKEVAV